jgi:peptide/nickel transport system permease protein
MLLRYAIKRALLAIPLLLGISIISFGILHLAPGGPTVLQERMDPRISQESIRELRSLYGLDKPVPVQYVNWLGRLVRLDFGVSFRDRRPVLTKILEVFPATLLLNILSMLIVFGIGIPMGIYSAVAKGSLPDRSLTLFSFLAYSIPAFCLALFLQLVFGVWLGILPVAGFRTPWSAGMPWWNQTLDVGWHLVLPVVVTSFGTWVAISRYMRNSLLEVLSQEYVRTAYAKGLSKRRVILGHALPNALLPVITILGLSLPTLIAGSIIIESIFAWPGMGQLTFNAAINYDYPVVMGTTILGAGLTVAGNLLADLAYGWVDPRVRY